MRLCSCFGVHSWLCMCVCVWKLVWNSLKATFSWFSRRWKNDVKKANLYLPADRYPWLDSYTVIICLSCVARGQPAFSQSPRSHASDAGLLAYLFPIQRPSPTKKTPEGQNKVSYLWMCQHGPYWNPVHTLSDESDKSTGAFSSQEKWYLRKLLVGWNRNLCGNWGIKSTRKSS